MSTMVHAQRAESIGDRIKTGEVSAENVTTTARQGDLILKRVGDSTGIHSTPDAGGIVLAAGQHGEHRLLVARARVMDDTFDIPVEGLVVHTDEPHARHGALKLKPGCWEFSHLQELGIDDSVEAVRD